mgnify:FL=1
MRYKIAPEIKQQVDSLIDQLQLDYIQKDRIHCIRSFDAKTRAYARIWGMSKLFKEVAGIEPHYIIEVISKKFDKLNEREKIKTLIHELMHIPRTFSGSLLSHLHPYRKINNQTVEKLFSHLR